MHVWRLLSTLKNERACMCRPGSETVDAGGGTRMASALRFFFLPQEQVGCFPPTQFPADDRPIFPVIPQPIVVYQRPHQYRPRYHTNMSTFGTHFRVTTCVLMLRPPPTAELTHAAAMASRIAFPWAASSTAARPACSSLRRISSPR